MATSSDEGQGVLEPGTLVNERYRIVQRLGSGGMGNVYLAEDSTTPGQRIALKILHKELLNDEKQRQRFLREVQLMRRISQRNVVRVFDVGTDGDLAFFTMEYVPGRQLEDFVQEHSFSLAKIPDLIIQLCEGLEAVHKAGVIHRDLKPANIIVLTDGTAKITDFGVARPEYSNLTAHNEIVGSALYIAPEVWIGTRMTHSIDLYSLGVILFELTTGVLPFEGDSPAALMRLHMDQPPANPKTLNSQIPVWLNKLILRLLEKSDVDRPRDAREVIEYVKLHTQQRESESYETTNGLTPKPSADLNYRLDTTTLNAESGNLQRTNREARAGEEIVYNTGGEKGIFIRLVLSAAVLLLFGLVPIVMSRLFTELRPMVLATTPSGISYLLVQGMELPSLPTTWIWVGLSFLVTLLFSLLPAALVGAAAGSPKLIIRGVVRYGMGVTLIFGLLLGWELLVRSDMADGTGALNVYSTAILVKEQVLQLAYLDPAITRIGHTAVPQGVLADKIGMTPIFASPIFILSYLFFAVQISGSIFRAVGGSIWSFFVPLGATASLAASVLFYESAVAVSTETALNSPRLMLLCWITIFLAILILTSRTRDEH